MLLGANPVFVDVDPRTFNIDLDDLNRRIDKVKADGRLNPRAVIAVDLFGLPPDYTTLNRICDENELFLIADAAQSFGGRRDNKAVGSLAPVTATSFFPPSRSVATATAARSSPTTTRLRTFWCRSEFTGRARRNTTSRGWD